MKILQIHNAYRHGGGEDAVVRTEASLLRQAGHQVTQHIVRNPQRTLRAASMLAVAAWNPSAKAALTKIAEGGFDVAHVHNTWYALSPSVFSALKRVGLRVVMTVHNYRLACINAQLTRDGRACLLCVGSSPWSGVRFSCYRDSKLASVSAAATIALNRRLDTWNGAVEAFLAPTPQVASVLQRSGIDEDRIFVKPHMIRDPGPRSAPPSSSRQVLFVGRLSPEKGLDLLLTAWSLLPHDEFKLVVVGDGSLRPELTRRFPRVDFRGRLDPDGVLALMKESRALVFPSLVPESFGLVVVEAMSCGLPVLASDDLPIFSLLDGTSGAVGLRPTSSSWLQGLQALEQNAALDVWGEAARRSYLDRFSPTVGLPSLEGHLRGAPAC